MENGIAAAPVSGDMDKAPWDVVLAISADFGLA